MNDRKTYAAIDLKSFYASVECVERGLDPLDTNLVVADVARTEKTICLAVSPSLKAYGISGRARLFEVVSACAAANAARRRAAPYGRLVGSSYSATALANDKRLALDYIAAPPRMAKYLEYSAKIYSIYLKFVAPEDVHVYSVDEVFIDISSYLRVQKLTAREFVRRIILAVFEETGITAAAGIGTNLYLCKVAMDIEAKHVPPDDMGVRIAELDERTYRLRLWEHKPITDFWRVGRGYAQRLANHGIYTMGELARASLAREDMLYREFGVNAELLIDHAWGHEPTEIADIKAYKPENSSISQGQVLHCPYGYEGARLIVREMADQLSLDLVERAMVTNAITLTVGYDIENVENDGTRVKFSGEIVSDYYGRRVPKQAHGTTTLSGYTNSTELITEATVALFERIIDKSLTVRRVNITAASVLEESAAARLVTPVQLDIFTDPMAEEEKIAAEKAKRARERKAQDALIDIKRKFGKNAVVKGMDLEEGATTIDRNAQIGGHKA